MPIFLFAMSLIADLGILIRCQDEVQWALTRVARETSAEYGAKSNSLMESRGYYQVKMNAYLKTKGLAVSLLESSVLEEKDEIDLIAVYRVQLPFRLIPVGICHFRQRVHTRAFTGVDRRGSGEDNDNVTVYVAETGSVYHRKENCTYLRLSVSQMKYGDIADLRNEGGGKYKPCERCVRRNVPGNARRVWITNFGDRFHTSRACSGIRRTVRAIRLSEVGKRAPCSKCGT